MESDDAIPIIGLHRGIPLEDQQSLERLALVKAEIDHVLRMTNASELADYAGKPWHAPKRASSRAPWLRLRGR